MGLKGLEDIITTSSVHPTWQKTRPGDDTDMHAGWAFAADDEVSPAAHFSAARHAMPRRGKSVNHNKEPGCDVMSFNSMSEGLNRDG